MKIENVKNLVEMARQGKDIRVLLTNSNQTEFTMYMIAALSDLQVESIYNRTLSEEQKAASMEKYEAWCDALMESGGVLQVMTSLQIPDIDGMLKDIREAMIVSPDMVFAVENYEPRPKWFDRLPTQALVLR